MTKLRFTRTEAWSSGWRGKHSQTGIFLDGAEVGTIQGRENAGMAGSMGYRVAGPLGPRLPDEYPTLAQAKAAVRRLMED